LLHSLFALRSARVSERLAYLTMLRFVILRHEMPSSARAGVHWDLMLEHHGQLRTWAIAAEPATGVEISADELPNHRLDYLQYEGPISGDRGEVRRWDEGNYEVLRESTGELIFTLTGKRLVGLASLRRQSAEVQRWTFLLSPS
jgi:hypothetical protein